MSNRAVSGVLAQMGKQLGMARTRAIPNYRINPFNALLTLFLGNVAHFYFQNRLASTEKQVTNEVIERV